MAPVAPGFAALNAGLRNPFPRIDRERQPVLRRRQRARPARVVDARRVVRVVEIEDESVRPGAEIGTLDRVVQVAAAAVGAAPVRRVTERQPQPAAVALEPVPVSAAASPPAANRTRPARTQRRMPSSASVISKPVRATSRSTVATMRHAGS